MPTPVLIFSDHPAASSGLARITRDIALRLSSLPEFRVATVGYGASGSSKLPFTQYSWVMNNDWVIHDLPEIWQDFAGDERGVFFTVQDASRMLWMNPDWCPDQNVKNFLKSKPFELWGYFPVDASGVGGRLTRILEHVLLSYDRVLAYTKWAENIVGNTLGIQMAKQRDLHHLPHGIDTSVFYPRDRKEARQNFAMRTVGRNLPMKDDELLIGIVATNQVRKDYGQAIAVCAELAKTKKVRIWIHTDALDRHWSIPYLLNDHGFNGAMITLQNFDDETMAKLYSACDVTLGIGKGEGWGMPLSESLACGTPVVHGAYGGGTEIVPEELQVPVTCYVTEGVYGCQRPVFRLGDWMKKIDRACRFDRAECPKAIAKYAWDNCWSQWQDWFVKGVSSGTEEVCENQSV